MAMEQSVVNGKLPELTDKIPFSMRSLQSVAVAVPVVSARVVPAVRVAVQVDVLHRALLALPLRTKETMVDVLLLTTDMVAVVAERAAWAADRAPR